MLGNSASQPNRTEEPETPELSPLWGLTVVLGEIALRVERDQARKQLPATQDASEMLGEGAA